MHLFIAVDVKSALKFRSPANGSAIVLSSTSSLIDSDMCPLYSMNLNNKPKVRLADQVKEISITVYLERSFKYDPTILNLHLAAAIISTR